MRLREPDIYEEQLAVLRRIDAAGSAGLPALYATELDRWGTQAWIAIERGGLIQHLDSQSFDFSWSRVALTATGRRYLSTRR
jgi:hypothetical protein